jgi:hypothetical protein
MSFAQALCAGRGQRDAVKGHVADVLAGNRGAGPASWHAAASAALAAHR